MENIPQRSSTRSQRVLAFLGGQNAPPATAGVGRRVLYRCPNCQRIWYQDSPKIRLDLDASEQARLLRFAFPLATLPDLQIESCIGHHLIRSRDPRVTSPNSALSTLRGGRERLVSVATTDTRRPPLVLSAGSVPVHTCPYVFLFR